MCQVNLCNLLTQSFAYQKQQCFSKNLQGAILETLTQSHKHARVCAHTHTDTSGFYVEIKHNSYFIALLRLQI